ncbi:MAM domain-containing glycosylphosphatidylinositol anchor protein 1 [Microtus ochrogaster]|uniref:MAM domain-containing glycosylphosphatidylinositol anchor protein 1 n=1 Tax=Microtus ochrogaster TaxID=79684 RepID=A0A8J6L3D1_MICOH|nr:MAM domain-containing glycosylphosphatidylinositol anchor protein 1 [Microtus ochrogaster]
MKSSEGPESSTAKPKLPSERSAPAAPEPEWPPCPGARPGPARWGPLGPRPPGGGRGRPTWGAAQPRSPEIAEPGSATAAARRRERTAETGGGWRLPSCCPGLGKSANYFQRTQTFLLPLLAAVPLALESFSGIPRGLWDALASPGFLGGGSANFVDPGTRSARSAAEFSPRCSRARQDRDPGRSRLREGRLAPIPWVGLPSPPHPLQNWSQRINLPAWLHGKRREGRGHRGAPADAPPAASQAAPPRGDEAVAVKMEVTCLLLLALIPFHCRGQGVYAPAQAQIVHAGQACVVKEDNISERVYTIRESDTLVLQCLVTGHPRPQVRWTKTAGSASDKFQETSVFNETLRIERIARTQGGRYYCKAENGVGVPAIKSIRVDVQYLDEPVLTVHQTVSDVRGNFYQEKTVFLRCTVSSNPPARFIWKRGSDTLSHSQDNGVDIYEPLYTQGETKVLKLKNLRPQDYASYTCQVSVRNVCGIPDKAITFQLTNTTAPPALKLSVNETLVVNPGDNVTVQCLLTGGDPLPQLHWSHGPGPLPLGALAQGGTLSIPSVQARDSGYYNCTATNNVGNPAKKTVNLLVRSLKNATFQITPDVIKESENIQLGQDLKLSCHVDAVPQEKVTYQWFKNGKPARMSKRLLVTRNDPELPAITSSLELIDLHFSDYGTYLCMASFPGSPVPDLSIEVNISSETVPPTISVPKGRSVVTVREGSPAELQCEVRGKPRPPVLWSRVDKEVVLLPSGLALEETPDGKLRLERVSRDMSGTYRCQTARYNGFNVRSREAQVQLTVHFPPEVEPSSQDVRQALGRPVLLRCTLLRGSPQRIASAVWRFKGQLLPPPPVVPAATEATDHAELRLDALTRDSSGSYECSVSNDVGSATCLFQVSAKAYSPEFYFDTPNPTRSHKLSKNYSYVLQWTQREPDAVDPVLNYRLSIRQLNQHNAMVKAIPVRRVEKGQLLEYILTDLRVPHSYEIRLTPYTTFGAGDMASRIIHYTEPINSPNLSDNTCHFEDEKICGYTQDLTDNFDWTRQNALTQNPKRSPNTGPPTDISGTPEGYYMFIETSRPRELGDRARLVSPLYNASAKFYCVSFFYHMYGKHIGSLNLLVRSRNKGALDTHAWSLSGNKGNVWQQAHVPINPSGPFQIIFEGVRGSGYLGDIAIDDVTLKKGECPRRQMDPNKGHSHSQPVDSTGTTWKLSFSVNIGCSQCSSHRLQTEETLFPHCPLLSAQEAGLAAKAGRCQCPHLPDVLPRTRKAAEDV